MTPSLYQSKGMELSVSKINDKNADPREYILNDKATAKKLIKAAKAEDLSVGRNLNNSFTLSFSTGSYVKIVLPLLDFWKTHKTIDKIDTDGLDTTIKSVICQNCQSWNNS